MGGGKYCNGEQRSFGTHCHEPGDWFGLGLKGIVKLRLVLSNGFGFEEVLKHSGLFCCCNYIAHYTPSSFASCPCVRRGDGEGGLRLNCLGVAIDRVRTRAKAWAWARASARAKAEAWVGARSKDCNLDSNS